MKKAKRKVRRPKLTPEIRAHNRRVRIRANLLRALEEFSDDQPVGPVTVVEAAALVILITALRGLLLRASL